MSSEFALSPPRKRPMELLRFVGWAVALAFLVWSWRGAEMRPMTLITESGNILTLIKDFFPPDFTDWRLYATEMVVTLQVAIWGTLLAVVCAVPLGILSSDNIVPWWVYHPVRRLMDAARAINEMVFAMLFVVAVGLGPFAGVLALWVHTTGVLAKLFSEAVEAIEPSPVEGVRSTGGPPSLRKSYTASSRRFSRCGSPIRCTASSPTCAPPPSWAWSARAASAWCCGS